MARILTPSYLPTALGLTPILSVSGIKCIRYGDTTPTDLDGRSISDPLCKFRYSNDYYLYWAAKTNANQYKLVNSYTKYSRHLLINDLFYKLYSPNIPNIPTVISASSHTHPYQSIALDYTAVHHYYNDTGSYHSPNYTYLTSYINNYKFLYTVLGTNTTYNFYPIDYLGKNDCTYDAYLIYSKPYLILFRNSPREDNSYTDRLNRNTPGNQAVDITVYDMPINTNTNSIRDYRADIVKECIHSHDALLFPSNAMTKLDEFYATIESNNNSYGYHIKNITPFSNPVYYLYDRPYSNYTGGWKYASDSGILGIHSKLYVKSWRILPVTRKDDSQYCYSSLMYEVLNNLVPNVHCSYPHYDDSSAGSSGVDRVLGLGTSYKIPDPVYEGAGTFSSQLKEGTIIVSDFLSNTLNNFYSYSDYVYKAFLYNHIDNRIQRGFHNIGLLESGLSNTLDSYGYPSHTVYTTNIVLNGTSVNRDHYNYVEFKNNLEVNDLPEAYSHMTDSYILNLYNIDVSGLSSSEKLNRILSEIKTHQFYYVHYYILVKISRLQNLINFAGSYDWDIYVSTLTKYDSGIVYEGWDEYAYSINGNNGDKLIPIPLFTIAIDGDSFLKGGQSSVPKSLRYCTNKVPLTNINSSIFIDNGTQMYDILTDSDRYSSYYTSPAYFHASLSYTSDGYSFNQYPN